MDDPEAETVGTSTINSYIASLVALWTEQRQRGVNNFPNPRNGALGRISETARRTKAAKNRRELVDRGKGLCDRGLRTFGPSSSPNPAQVPTLMATARLSSSKKLPTTVSSGTVTKVYVIVA